MIIKDRTSCIQYIDPFVLCDGIDEEYRAMAIYESLSLHDLYVKEYETRCVVFPNKGLIITSGCKSDLDELTNRIVSNFTYRGVPVRTYYYEPHNSAFEVNDAFLQEVIRTGTVTDY